jgi:hypothetical protein
MQLGNGIYYSTVHYKLNMFRAVCRSSSGAPTVFSASRLRTSVGTARCQVPVRLDYGRSPQAYVNQRLQIQLGLLMMSDIPLETCWAFNVLWNNKFRYQVASCWLLLQGHTTMHGSMNIKQYTSLIISLSILQSMKNVSHRICRENWHSFYVQYSPLPKKCRLCAVWKRM